MATSLLLRSNFSRYITRQQASAGTVWLRKAQASTAAAQEEGEFKYVPGGRESSLPFVLINALA